MSQTAEVEAFRELLHDLRTALDRFERESFPDDVGGVRARALVELSRLAGGGEERSAKEGDGGEEQAPVGVEMSELIGALEIDQSNVSRLCKRMHDDGQVERVVCCKDRRARRLKLTEDGEALADAARASAQERAQKLMEQMSDLERLTVSTALKLLTGAIAASGSAPE
jgi:DNA-binding MarR family transcriptional regulator